MKWLSLLLDRPDPEKEKKAVDTAAIKAEASSLVGKIRRNLDHLEDAIEALPDTESDVGDTVPDE